MPGIIRPEGAEFTKEQIAEMDAYEADYAARQYQRERYGLYPGIREQLDLLWHAIDTDTLDNKDYRNKFYTKLKKVKEDNPKG